MSNIELVTLKTKEEVLELISGVLHPAINYSLIDLGILKCVEVNGNIAEVTFAFPFPTIPIADALVDSIAKLIIANGFEFKFKIELMTIEEKDKFIKMEMDGWVG